MIKLNKTTQKAKRFIRAYQNSTNYRLEDCYNNYSYAKERAFDYCINKMEKMGGSYGCIIGYNTCFFTFAFEVNDKGGNEDECKRNSKTLTNNHI